MKEHLQALITVLSLVNPVVCGSMFARIEAHRARGDKVTDATKTALSIATILVIAALLGTQLLHMFGVSLDAFMVAGGGVLSWMGYRMLSGYESSAVSPNAPAGTRISLTPLVLFAASPGTITGVITLSAAHSRLDLPIAALVAVVVASILTWLVLLLMSRLATQETEGGFARATMTSFMGLIVLAMGVQFGLTGLRQFWLGGG
jgi:multiple antibiotic resistance protein